MGWRMATVKPRNADDSINSTIRGVINLHITTHLNPSSIPQMEININNTQIIKVTRPKFCKLLDFY